MLTNKFSSASSLLTGLFFIFLGACSECLSLDATLKDGIEAILLDEVPGVTEVRLAPSEPLFF